MNNNNVYNTNNWVGTTHLDNFKTTSNIILINSSNYTLETSNILEGHLTNTSNILELHSSNYTNITSNYIINRYDKLIGEEIFSNLLPPSTQINTYIYNNSNFGDICFKTSFNYPVNSNFTGTKIDYTGKLLVYHNYNVLQPTFAAGYYDVEGEILGLKADGINTDAQLTGLEGTILVIQGEVYTLVEATNQLEAEINAITSAIYFNNTYESFKNTIQSANLQQLQATYGTLITNIRLTGSQIYNNSVSSGLFTTALFGLTVGAITAIGTGLYYQYASNALISNSNFTTLQKRAIYESNINNQLQTYNEYSTALSNINLIQGFINSNITTQQYIPSLKCDTLNLNTGNISNINYITANEIISAGKIKQNNILLDNTYLSSNHIYNLSYNYTAERQYPPKLYNSSSTEETVSLLNKQVYRQILFLNTTSIAYASGFYEVFSSSTYDNGITNKDKLFNHNTSETTTSPRWAISLYNSGTGNYQGDNSIDGSYYGDWVIIKLPQPILLTRYRIYQRSDFLTKAPAEWRVYGSNDGVNFIEITEASQTTRLSSYTSGFYEKSLNPSFTTQYQYIGFVFNKLLSTSGQTDLSFAELQIFGKEILNNSIVSNIYATSNAVKNIVLYEMPRVNKKSAFYCQTTNLIYPDGTTPFYAYHLYLPDYVATGFIQIGSGSGDTYRIFTIRCFFGSSYFQKLTNNIPDIVEYTIYMSNKASAGGDGTIAGVNICAMGEPVNYHLNNLMKNNLFILRNNTTSQSFNFNYLSIITKQQSDVRVFITDLLS